MYPHLIPFVINDDDDDNDGKRTNIDTKASSCSYLHSKHHAHPRHPRRHRVRRSAPEHPQPPGADMSQSGASCSGKTLLAKHLARLLGPGHSVLIHQDDFAPTSEMVPVSPEFGVQDWDDPPTCVEWPRMRQVLGAIRQSGKVPQEHDSFDHLNAQVEVGVDGGVVHEWGTKLGQVTVTGGGEEKIVWVLVDGFVLYWDRGVSDALDVKLLMRVPRAVLKARREARATYVLQSE